MPRGAAKSFATRKKRKKRKQKPLDNLKTIRLKSNRRNKMSAVLREISERL